MQGFQNFKNDPRHWNIDADEGVPFSVNSCNSIEAAKCKL